MVARSAKGQTHGRWEDDSEPIDRIVLYDKDGKLTGGQARHIARHDPARVLRRIAADRRRLARHTPEPMVGSDSDENDPATYVLGCPTCQVTIVRPGDWPCDELRDMLAEHEDHPDFDPAWLKGR